MTVREGSFKMLHSFTAPAPGRSDSVDHLPLRQAATGRQQEWRPADGSRRYGIQAARAASGLGVERHGDCRP